MSLLATSVYANANQPCFVPFVGGGSGSNITVDTLNINQGGEIVIGSSINQITPIQFNKDLSGTSSANLQMNFDYPGTSPSNLALSCVNQGGIFDLLQCSAIKTFGPTLANGETPSLGFGNVGGNVGITYKDGGTGAITPFMTLVPATTPTMILNNMSDFFTDISGTQVKQPKIQTGAFASSGSSGSNVVTLPQSYSGTYLVFPVMEDTSPAEMSAVVNTADTFTIYWANAGGGSHTIAWMTTGS